VEEICLGGQRLLSAFWREHFMNENRSLTQTSFSSMNSPSLSAGLKRNEASYNRCTLCMAL
jgi:hypothetical protein